MKPITANRITSVDFLRGTIMIIMALDHVRDYLFRDSFYYDPLDLTQTSVVLFFTRWITHFCAPIFMLLAGVSAYLVGQKKSKNELAAFLFKRGLWLIFLEMIVVNFGWNFNIAFPMFFFITIWALGVCMIVLAGLVYLPKKIILAFSLIIIFGHNALDGLHVPGNTLPAFGWSILHEQQFFMWHKEALLVGYPLVPWIAVMPLGYLVGEWFAKDYDAAKRVKNLMMAGGGAILLFIVLRYSNLYGDPVKWTTQKNGLYTFLSFLKVNKYPPSLLYLCVTLGAAFLFLAFTEKMKGAVVNVVSVYGRVPMFYYLTHIYIIHLIALLASAFTPGQNWHIWILQQPIWFTESLRGYGFSLPVSYFIWIAVVAGLYPFCKRYDAYKQAHKEKWWLSYL
ncbi:MAG: heparan-alpha-glucosaminide N-acetyltransferase domain-containing protein [Chitinophagaceae bacterium]